MHDISWQGWAILAAGAFFIGLSKTGVPGLGTLAILIVAYVIPAKASTGLILPMLIVGDVFAVAYYRRHAVWRHILRLSPFAAVGIIFGTYFLGKVNDRQLRLIIGSVVLILLAINWWRNRKGDLPIPTGWWFPAVMGLLAGVVTMMANAAGPIMMIYLLAMRLPKDAFIGTGAWYFMLLNLYKVPFSAGIGLINPGSIRINLMLAPMIVVGALIGILVAKRIPEKTFNGVVQWLAAFGAVKLMF